MTLVQIGFLVPIVIDFKAGTDLQAYVDEIWIPELGIHYALGLDGLNIFMIALTVARLVGRDLLPPAASECDQPRMFYAMLALAEVGTLGAFMAQDLILFILFFDLLLIPFYFLIGMWGRDGDLGNARRATTTFMIYTLAGSLLMLVARGRARRAHRRRRTTPPLSFHFVDLQRQPGRASDAELDLPRLHARAAGQDADPAAARLDADHLPRDAAAGADRALGGRRKARRLRLPARRAAADAATPSTTSSRCCWCSR